jgi:hypothetical protein
MQRRSEESAGYGPLVPGGQRRPLRRRHAPSWQSPGQVGYSPDGDPLELVIRWTEQGKAPDEILASQVKAGQVVRTRPLCPYPKMQRYKGAGSIDRAENFVCL